MWEACLDKRLMLNERHVQRVLMRYVEYFNYARPHQDLHQRCPVVVYSAARAGPMERRDLVGGVLHTSYRCTA